MFKYFFIPAFDFFSEYDLYLYFSESLNNNFMTTSKPIDFSNKIGSDRKQVSEFQVFKIKINYSFEIWGQFLPSLIPTST